MIENLFIFFTFIRLTPIGMTFLTYYFLLKVKVFCMIEIRLIISTYLLIFLASVPVLASNYHRGLGRFPDTGL